MLNGKIFFTTLTLIITALNFLFQNKFFETKIRWIYVEKAARWGEMEFSLYGEEGGELVVGVENFKYLGLPLDQT